VYVSESVRGGGYKKRIKECMACKSDKEVLFLFFKDNVGNIGTSDEVNRRRVCPCTKFFALIRTPNST
jgi:hypothetical protein